MSDNITITKIGGETGLSTVLNSGIVGSKLGGALGLIKNENGALSFSSDGVTFTPVNSGGGEVDESRLLPELATIPEGLSGHPVVYDYQSGIDENTLCLLHLDEASWVDATNKNTVSQHSTKAVVANDGYFNHALDLTVNDTGAPDWITIPWISEYDTETWTIEFFAKPTKSVVNFMFFSFGDSESQFFSMGSQNLSNLWIGNGSPTYSSEFKFELNTWYWIVIQYDGSAVKVYVDEKLIVQGNFTPNMKNQNLQFGNLNLVENGDNTFIGYLDEFRWSKGLRYPNGLMKIPTQPFGQTTKSYIVSEKEVILSDNSRLLPAEALENTIVVGTSENKWGTTTKQEFLSDIDNRVSALESALGTVESSLDQIITGK